MWNPEFVREKRKSGEWVGQVPTALEHFKDWQPVQFDGPLKCLILSDVHIPFHDKKAVQLALKYGQNRRANFVLLNGDILDFFSISRWEKDPRQRNFPKEVDMGKRFLQIVRGCFPNADIVFKEGNHEERWEACLRTRCADFLGIPEFDWDEVYKLSELDIQRVGDKRPVRLGKLNVIHGHEYNFAISNPVNPARGFFLRCKNHVIGGHFHHTSEHSEKTLEQKVLSAWSTGCLCSPHPDYKPLNNWNHGFAFVTIDKQGMFRVENKKIIQGRVL